MRGRRNTPLWLRLLIALVAPVLVACGAASLEGRPTSQPLLRVTPAPTQDVPGTQTAYAVQIIPTPTPMGLYIIKAGDTLSKIADAFATTVDEITRRTVLLIPSDRSGARVDHSEPARANHGIYRNSDRNPLTSPITTGTLPLVFAPSKRHSYRLGMKEVMPMSDMSSGITAEVTK
jgi:hypothetical protein